MPTPFIKKLENMLDNPTYHDFVVWNHQKTAIEILDEQNFEKVVLPAYFRHAKLSSFVRQLNLYGFKKLRYPGRYTYTHPQLKHRRNLLEICAVKNILRQEIIEKEASEIIPKVEPQDEEVPESDRESKRIQEREVHKNLEQNIENINIKSQVQINQVSMWMQPQNEYIENQPLYNYNYFPQVNFYGYPCNIFYF